MKPDSIDDLTESLRQLRIDYERFFNGALEIPPLEQAERIRLGIRALRGKQGTALVDRFRLTQLEARFNTYSELFRRRTRDLEEGRGPALRPRGEATRHDPRQGIVLGGPLEPQAVEALYAGLARGSSSPRFDLDTFHSYLDRQLSTIRSKTGAEKVRFRLVEEDGKTRLKAMPLKGA